jgi:hypothetical protein
VITDLGIISSFSPAHGPSHRFPSNACGLPKPRNAFLLIERLWSTTSLADIPSICRNLSPSTPVWLDVQSGSDQPLTEHEFCRVIGSKV